MVLTNLIQSRYSDSFATRIAEAIHAQCSVGSRVAFLCAPTAFVAFQNVKQSKEAYVFEVDQRFAVLSPRQYVFYDLDEPEAFPQRFRHYFDFVVADPPFLNEVRVTTYQLRAPIQIWLFHLTG
jgi:hypothetical protein